jgi:hypothetical protein
MDWTNTLAFYTKKLVTTKKSFMIQPPGLTFKSIIVSVNPFSYSLCLNRYLINSLILSQTGLTLGYRVRVNDKALMYILYFSRKRIRQGKLGLVRLITWFKQPKRASKHSKHKVIFNIVIDKYFNLISIPRMTLLIGIQLIVPRRIHYYIFYVQLGLNEVDTFKSSSMMIYYHTGQGKSTALLSANVNGLSAFRRWWLYAAAWSTHNDSTL